MIFNTRTARSFNPGSLLLFVTFNMAYLSVYAINYVVVAPRYLKLKSIHKYVMGFFFLVLCFAGVRFLLEEVIVYLLFDFHNYNLNRSNIVAIYLTDSTIYAFKPVLFSSLMFLFFRNREHRERLHQLELQQQEAKLAMLRSQISPHFLFNTLNGFYSDLYESQPKTAADILKLSNLLRYVTYDTNKNFMPLAKELMFIKDYLYFYEKRFEEEFYVSLSVEGDVAEQEIPALMLIHFIENLFKHGVINDPHAPAIIAIKIQNKQLSIETLNTINTAENYSDTGIGTANLKGRLQLLFGSNFEFYSQAEAQQYRAYLKIPLHD